jgi:hypothetical protein
MPGIADGMWCDLAWNFKKYFGHSRGVGSAQLVPQLGDNLDGRIPEIPTRSVSEGRYSGKIPRLRVGL